MELTAEFVHELLDYRPDTGEFFWKVSRGGIPAGSRAGYVQINKSRKCVTRYRVMRIGKLYMAHVLAWLIQTGRLPETMIDHRDGNSLNNEFSNLRPATCSQNCQNSKKRSDNKSGFKGVSWDSFSGKWVARIRVHRGKYLNLGRFDTAGAAHEAYKSKAENLYGEFARTQ